MEHSKDINLEQGSITSSGLTITNKITHTNSYTKITNKQGIHIQIQKQTKEQKEKD